jgi:sugar phosphate permease
MADLKAKFKRDMLVGDAMKFIILLGIVSLLADMTYEGARSITGPYLAILGASATLVGFVAGFGELMGYTLRFVSGYFADKSRQYWAMTIIGYVVNLLAVPLLALAGNWPLAAMLIIMERIGKGIRTPPRDVMLSHATSQVGQGWGFGLHEAMDQIGAITGPLIVALILYLHGNYQAGFAFLLLPALLA